MGQHGLIGASMQSPADVSYLADTVILLRVQEIDGGLSRSLSMMKRRGGEIDTMVRDTASAGKGCGSALLSVGWRMSRSAMIAGRWSRGRSPGDRGCWAGGRRRRAARGGGGHLRPAWPRRGADRGDPPRGGDGLHGLPDGRVPCAGRPAGRLRARPWRPRSRSRGPGWSRWRGSRPISRPGPISRSWS